MGWGGGRQVFFQSEKIVINVKTFRPCGRPIIAARRRFTTDSKTYPDSIFAVFINNNQPSRLNSMLERERGVEHFQSRLSRIDSLPVFGCKVELPWYIYVEQF